MLCFAAKTNKEYCMINILIATMPDGRKYVFDRDTTEYSIEDNGDLFMDWYGIYLWEADDIHKLNPFVCHRRKPTTFRWWDEPYESLAINLDSQYTFV